MWTSEWATNVHPEDTALHGMMVAIRIIPTAGKMAFRIWNLVVALGIPALHELAPMVVQTRTGCPDENWM
jgi:hypothetical protein